MVKAQGRRRRQSEEILSQPGMSGVSPAPSAGLRKWGRGREQGWRRTPIRDFSEGTVQLEAMGAGKGAYVGGKRK